MSEERSGGVIRPCILLKRFLAVPIGFLRHYVAFYSIPRIILPKSREKFLVLSL